MKQLSLLFSMLLASLCLWAAPTSAGINTDDLPPNRPPSRSSAVAIAYTSISLDQLEVIFLDDADEAVVEVYDANGTSVYCVSGKVDSYDRLRVDTHSWQGTYTVQVTLKGRSQTFVLNL